MLDLGGGMDCSKSADVMEDGEKVSRASDPSEDLATKVFMSDD